MFHYRIPGRKDPWREDVMFFEDDNTPTRKEVDKKIRDEKKKKMKAFLDKLDKGLIKREISYLVNIRKPTASKVYNNGFTSTVHKKSSIFFVNPIFNNGKKYKLKVPLVKKVKYEESILLNLKNHLINYPTPINLTHS
jgi:hypothetical protein